ncbi:MAG: peptidoglycan bridge formation glycyltransferase FemA/FemB family protein [Caldilineaceae bacterium]|nr:peptidoglycan bridge formation glycyltransferase FemA/FemB family protein [Caldilineaceae bacterium]
MAAHPHGQLLQTTHWGALKSRFGWRDQPVALFDRPGGEIIAGSQLLFRRVLGLTLAYAPRGPLTDWADLPLNRQLVDALDAVSRRAGAAVLKIEPDLLDTPANRARLRQLGFTPSRQSIQPASTILLDISQDEDALLAAMKSKWRYNIRLAERKGVSVREARQDDLAAFNELMGATGQRDGFAVHSASYYRAAFDLLAPHSAVFLLAEYEGQPLAAIVVCAVGNRAWYLWGASSNRERNRMPNHALQWAAIQWAKGRGVTCYDFWGIPDEIGQLAVGIGRGEPVPAAELPVDLNQLPGHGLWGVYRLKQGFGGDVVRTVGAWDRPVQPGGYRLYQLGIAGQEAQRTVRQLAATARDRRRQDRARLAELAEIDEATAWRAALARFAMPHVLQSWEWGALKGADRLEC